jgi:hypothetical protein
MFNQVRIIDAKGALVGAYAKKCLTYGDAKMFPPVPRLCYPDCRRSHSSITRGTSTRGSGQPLCRAELFLDDFEEVFVSPALV